MKLTARGYIFVAALSAIVAVVFGIAGPVAAADSSEFSVQVSPSPLVATVKPGQTTELEVKIRNNSTSTENLKIAPRSFKIDSKTGDLQISDTQEPEMASWVSFGAPTFSVPSGQTFTEKITLAVPKEAGFSYSFSLVVTRNAPDPQLAAGRVIRPSVAIFTLINVDRPGATRKLEIASFTTTKGSYEYLPAEFKIELKNTGNTIVQPAGNVFIQRGKNDKIAIDTLTVNEGAGYILPGTTRTLSVKWQNGFQVIQPKEQPDGTTKDELTWDWAKLGDMRFGQYTAKLIVIYNDGARDVPLQSDVTFWVFPWVIVLVVTAIAVLVIAGMWSFVSKIFKLSKRVSRKKTHL